MPDCCSGRTRFLVAGYYRVVPVTHEYQAVYRCVGAALSELLSQRNVGTAAVSGK